MEAFKIYHAARLGIDEVSVHAYPGNRLGDAGLIFAQQALQQRPDAIILEVTIEDISRGVDFDERHLSHLVHLLSSNGILPIFLALPKPNGSDPYGNPNYEKVRKFTDKMKQLMCVIELPKGADRSLYYRDTVHTTTRGAIYYAERIADFICTIKNEFLHTANFHANLFRFSISQFAVPKPGDFNRMLFINRAVRSESGSILILHQQKIGPVSPVVEVALTTGNIVVAESKLSIWDPYCHILSLCYGIRL